MSMPTRNGFVKTEEDAINDTEALKLRSKGYTYQKIADILGVSKSTAHQRVKRALAAIPAEAVEEYRRLEGERLDALLEVATAKALDPESKGAMFAIDRCLAIMDRRAKLLGLDAPTKHEVLTLDAVTAEIKRLEAQLGETDDNSTREVIGITEA